MADEQIEKKDTLPDENVGTTDEIVEQAVEVKDEDNPGEKVQEVPVDQVSDLEMDKKIEEEKEAVAVKEEKADKIEEKQMDIEAAGAEESDEKSKKSIKQEGKQGWYVIHTYSGYEDQVAESLKQRIDSMGMKDFIFAVIVPTEKQIEIKNGKRSVVEKKIFPGYVLVEMNVTDESWYVVRNTPNVTGFVGFGVRPTPMSEAEIARIQKRMSIQEPKHKIEFKIDDLVRINDGPLKGFEGKVTDIDEGKGKIKVSVNMFGRETPANIDFLQAKKV